MPSPDSPALPPGPPAQVEPLDFAKLRVYPLASRRSLTRVEQILVSPDDAPGEIDPATAELVQQCAAQICAARAQSASVMLLYGAHLLRNGAALILERMMERGWITHLATNGAG